MNKITQSLLCVISLYGAGLFAQAPLCLLSVKATVDGTVTAQWEGGEPDYTVTFSAGTPTPQTIAENTAKVVGIAAGTPVVVTVTDSSSPAVAVSGTVYVGNAEAPNAITLSLSDTQASCGLANGSITVTINGGTPNFTYTLIDHGTTIRVAQIVSSSRTVTFSNVAAGTYDVIVTDTPVGAEQANTSQGQIDLCNRSGISSSDNPITNFIIKKYCNGCLITE